ncbi:MAG TPA: hypothetical protein VKS22_05985 [Candidatus Binataceae bacterium]|nr:hypothetical protein [Candidatus Binataceae bacterium]
MNSTNQLFNPRYGHRGRSALYSLTIILAAVIAYPQISAAKPKPKITVALWVANGTNVLEFDPGDFKKGTHNTKPHLTLNSAAGFGAPQGVNFDTAGDLWVIDGGTTFVGGTSAPALDEFTPTQLNDLKKKKDKTPAPNVTLTSTSFVFPQQAVFDTLGNLWVSDNGANSVFAFTAAQLLAGGAQTPTVTITSNPTFTGPLGITFGANGNLWVANNGTTTIFEFNAGDLPPLTSVSSVTLTPNVILSDDGANSIQGPWALAFDATGNLWSSNANTPFTVVEFAHAVLGASGSPTPAVTLSPTTDKKGNDTLAAPNGIAFDNLGNLATVSSATPFGVGSFAVSQLTAGGAVVPNTLLVGKHTTLSAPAGCNFGPNVKK